MKKTLFAIFIAILSLLPASVFAQGKYGADSAECIKYLSYYKEYFKQKSYDEALPNWRKAYSLCPPTANQALLLDGTTLVRRLITKNAKNPIYKQGLVDTLLTLHDLRAEYYPKYAVTALNNKGADIHNYILDEPKELYKLYSDIIEKNGDKTKPTFFLYNFDSAVKLYQESALSAEDILNLYESSTDVLSKVETKTDMEAQDLAKVKTDLESLFIASKVASCDQLVALFTPKFEADPDNLELVNKIVKMMNTAEDCLDNDLYLATVTKLNELNPSYQAAYFLAKLHISRNNAAEAIKYIEEAIASEDSDDATDGQYYYDLAGVCYKNNMTAKAYESARKAATLNPDYAGRAYQMMANIWGAIPCNGDEIQKAARYWVACDFMKKAIAADASIESAGNSAIRTWSAYFPKKSVAFMYDLADGDSYSVSCGGLSATTTVRTIK